MSEDIKLEKVFEESNDFLTANLLTSDDKLKLFLSVSRKDVNDEHITTRDELMTLLSLFAINTSELNIGVIDDIVKQLNEAKVVEPRRIKKGIPAISGKNAKVLYLIKPYQPNITQEEKDFIDLRYIRSFDNVEKDTIVARLYPPQDGVSGIDVFGNEIQATKGQELSITTDDSIERLPANDGKRFETFIAKKDGYLAVDKNNLSIKDELIINGHIDFKTGDIDFIGKVFITGNVLTNFTVTARNEIEIHGEVQGGRLHSKQGYISIKGSINGGKQPDVLHVGGNFDSRMLMQVRGTSKAAIKCREHLKAFSILNSSIEVGGHVEVINQIMNSSIRARGSVLMPEGHLLGGVTYAVCGLDIGTIGSPGGGKTVILLCSDVESTSDYRDIVAAIDAHDEAIELLQLQLGPYADDPEKIKSLPVHHRDKINRLYQKLTRLDAGKKKLMHDKNFMLSDAKYNKMFQLNFQKILYEGVEIQAGGEVFTADSNIEGPGTLQYIPEKGEFELKPLEPLECLLPEQENKMEK
jgi:uncharacterized protein